MDLLAKRYASPFVVLDEMMRQGRLYEFVLEFDAIVTEETQESKLWDVWLHKVFDKNWDEWNESLRRRSQAKAATKAELEATIKNSMELLKDFNPDDGR